MYTQSVLKYFKKPKNLGKIKNADAQAQVGNPVCGDIMRIYLKIKGKKISDIKFETLGCLAAIATSSAITELAKGKTVEAASKITFDDIAKKLGGLPKAKMHCSHLAVEALQAALQNYAQKNQQS